MFIWLDAIFCLFLIEVSVRTRYTVNTSKLRYINKWRFPKMGVPPNHPFLGTPISGILQKLIPFWCFRIGHAGGSTTTPGPDTPAGRRFCWTLRDTLEAPLFLALDWAIFWGESWDIMFYNLFWLSWSYFRGLWNAFADEDMLRFM